MVTNQLKLFIFMPWVVLGVCSLAGKIAGRHGYAVAALLCLGFYF